LENNNETIKRLQIFTNNSLRITRTSGSCIDQITSETWICGGEPANFQWNKKSGKEDVDIDSYWVHTPENRHKTSALL